MSVQGQSLPSHSALVRINVRFPTSSDRLSEITKTSLRATNDQSACGKVKLICTPLVDFDQPVIRGRIMRRLLGSELEGRCYHSGNSTKLCARSLVSRRRVFFQAR